MGKRDRGLSISSSDLESLFMSSDSDGRKKKKKEKKEKKPKKEKKEKKEKKSRVESLLAADAAIAPVVAPQVVLPPPPYCAPTNGFTGGVVNDEAAVEAIRVKKAEEEQQRLAAYEAAKLAQEAAEEAEWRKEVDREANNKHTVQAALETAVMTAIDDSAHSVAPTGSIPSFLKASTTVAEAGSDDDIMDTSSDEDDDGTALLSLMAVDIKRETKAEIEAAQAKSREAALRGLLSSVKASERQQAVAEDEATLNSQSGALVVAEGGGAVAVFAEDEGVATDARHAGKHTLGHSKVADKIKILAKVDHSSIEYHHFEKDFFIAPPESARLSEQEVLQLRKELDGAVAKGDDIPPPIRSWVGIGLPQKTLEYLQTKNFDRPLAIQSIAIPILMSGRDLLAIAKTGSGKTLSYAIPLVRHVLNQKRCGTREGPIGLILVPTRELSSQVFDVVKEVAVASSVGSGHGERALMVGASFGGSSMEENIKECTAGTDIMVATPGRLLDLCTLSRGKVLSLRRCTFVIVDEVDRMLDSAFKDHTEAFLRNVRPDRQVALLSGTLPESIKGFGRQMLNANHIEVVVGGRPSPSTNVKQSFIVFEKEEHEPDPLKQKPNRRVEHLLRILSEEVMRKKTIVSAATGATLTDTEALVAQSKGEAVVARFPLVLIFVHSIPDCDMLYAKLDGAGYGRMTGILHKDMDPIDRHAAVVRFNPSDRCILIATGVVERGLDINGLELVVNYWMPNHFEAYIHRVGRTGRAGKTGRAISFYTKDRDCMLAEQLVRSLADQEDAGTRLPDAIRQDAQLVKERRKAGLLKDASGDKKGFGMAKGHSFSTKEAKKKLQEDLKACGLGDYVSDDEDAEEGGIGGMDDNMDIFVNSGIREVPAESEGGVGDVDSTALVLSNNQAGALSLVSSSRHQDLEARAAAAKSHAEKITTGNNMFTCDFVINNFPKHIRIALQKKAFHAELQEKHNVTIIPKGHYIDPKSRSTHKMKEGDRELSLEIRGRYRDDLQEVLRSFEEAKQKAIAKARMSESGLGHRVVFEE